MNKIIEGDMAYVYQANLPWENFAGQTVLITGASGFLPAYMVETLLYINRQKPDQNITVLALVRNLEKAKTRFKDHLDDKHLILVHKDVCDEMVFDRKVDYIVHAASQASPKYYGVDPVGTLNANVLGTINLMKLAKKDNVRSFLFFSSGDVYGQVDESRIPMKEDHYAHLDPTNVRSCYGESKRMGETICASWFYQYGVPAKMVRPFHTYGPKMLLDDGRVFADFVNDILNNRDINLNSDGSAQRAFCYLADATIAFFTVLLKGENGQAYNVGNPYQEYSILQLAHIMTGLYPEKGLKVSSVQKTIEGNNYLKSPINRGTPDISKLEAFGWKPQISAEDGFRKVVESYLV
ncbi:NAD-dependent epimerase/dehydratase family protein [Mucilaginibacter mali]|uniref:NAD-dependent epimerase/dehydratase family protein n=1 Tax=Mucilaginibacter mali TaxID=2740462 RepID=A0A7D4QGX9_9SPHI|nr:NAD-dependent epimerase/dehydratase family protein [Mucilaginibacter mali]QKJ31492.1 NAD-dependent epimerase/dehydratase family protein [Mucilaginibacter mali]